MLIKSLQECSLIHVEAVERVHNARHKNVTSALNTTFFKTSEL